MEEVLDLFMKEHGGYIHIHDIPKQKIKKFLEQDYVKSCSIEKQVDLMRDWILSQDLAEVTP